MNDSFQASGDMSDWPRNVPGKPTQAAVFGIVDKDGSKRCQILWTGKFPDLDKALYWAAKHEMTAVRKHKWIMASRVAWQHDLTPEQAVEHAYRVMEPQVDRAMGHIQRTDSLEGLDIGDGLMKPVDVSKAEKVYVEVVSQDDEAAEDPLASFIAPGSILDGLGGKKRGMMDDNGCCN